MLSEFFFLADEAELRNSLLLRSPASAEPLSLSFCNAAFLS